MDERQTKEVHADDGNEEEEYEVVHEIEEEEEEEEEEDKNIDWESVLDQTAGWLKEADRVLIAAGAGISVEAGNDYNDAEAFKQRFPAMVNRGIARIPYEMIGRSLPPKLSWGYLSQFVTLVRFTLPQHPVYTDLLSIIKHKDYFVITSNADGMFVRNGFDPDKLYTPQGDFKYMQCKTPCDPHAYWESQKILADLVPKVNLDTCELPDEALCPRCPKCNGNATMNVRGGDYFLETPFKEQETKFVKWVEESANKKEKLLIVEIGSGFNTPGVIRFRMEHITRHHPQAKMIRVNLEYAHIPHDLYHARTAIGLKMSATKAIAGLQKRLMNNTNKQDTQK